MKYIIKFLQSHDNNKRKKKFGFHNFAEHELRTSVLDNGGDPPPVQKYEYSILVRGTNVPRVLGRTRRNFCRVSSELTRFNSLSEGLHTLGTSVPWPLKTVAPNKESKSERVKRRSIISPFILSYSRVSFHACSPRKVYILFPGIPTSNSVHRRLR